MSRLQQLKGTHLYFKQVPLKLNGLVRQVQTGDGTPPPPPPPCPSIRLLGQVSVHQRTKRFLSTFLRGLSEHASSFSRVNGSINRGDLGGWERFATPPPLAIAALPEAKDHLSVSGGALIEPGLYLADNGSSAKVVNSISGDVINLRS